MTRFPTPARTGVGEIGVSFWNVSGGRRSKHSPEPEVRNPGPSESSKIPERLRVELAKWAQTLRRILGVYEIASRRI